MKTNLITRISVFCSFGLFLALSSGCYTVKDEIFVQNAEVQGTVSQLPMHVTPPDAREDVVRISPHFSASTQKSISTSLEPSYSGQIPDTLPDFQRSGMQLSLPRMQFGMDFDYTFSNRAAFMGGFSLGVGEGKQFTSGYLGLGLFRPAADSGASIRLDFGVRFFNTLYKGATILVRTVDSFSGSSTKETYYFVDRGRESHYNVFASLTINSAHRDAFVNWFLQIGIAPQTLTEYTPEESISTNSFGGGHIVSDTRAESSVLWLSGTPGIYLNAGPSTRVLLGVRLMNNILADSPLLVTPLMQIDWEF